MTVSELGKKLGEYAALAVILGGVGSLWIDREVERRMNELAVDPSAAPVVVELKTDMENVKASNERIEGKVDAFSSKFMEYLERQAN